jgi:hypothetical protein
LARFKALMETGEIPTTKGQPVGEAQLPNQRKQEAKEAVATSTTIATENSADAVVNLQQEIEK